jgi:hypothetical protein
LGHIRANLARFLLEVLAYVAMGLWGWHRRDDGFRILIALAVPLLAAVLWGLVPRPNDPSRSGSIPVPGMLRLALELCFFSFATWVLSDLKFPGSPSSSRWPWPFTTRSRTTASGGSLLSRSITAMAG